MVEVRAMHTPICDVKIDRIIISASHPTSTPPAFYGFRIVSDKFIRCQGRVKTYLRGRAHRNSKTGTQINLGYQSVLPGLDPFTLTVIANDSRGLSYREIEQIIRAFETYQLTLVEVALDFPPESHLDADYVRRHALFGKTRPRTSRRYPGKLRYGGRRSDKLVRCYFKKQIGCFRVELELHANLLRRFGIVRLEDLKKLPGLLHPRHIKFARVNWQKLNKHLSHQHASGMQGAQPGVVPTASIHKTLGFLRKCAGVKNAHRFLLSMRVNRRILRALKHWAHNCQ
jgi:hypothetical protein